jgi:hypothetical protein
MDQPLFMVPNTEITKNLSWAYQHVSKKAIGKMLDKLAATVG